MPIAMQFADTFENVTVIAPQGYVLYSRGENASIAGIANSVAPEVFNIFKKGQPVNNFKINKKND